MSFRTNNFGFVVVWNRHRSMHSCGWHCVSQQIRIVHETLSQPETPSTVGKNSCQICRFHNLMIRKQEIQSSQTCETIHASRSF